MTNIIIGRIGDGKRKAGKENDKQGRYEDGFL
jgi:hypothetical protein